MPKKKNRQQRTRPTGTPRAVRSLQPAKTPQPAKTQGLSKRQRRLRLVVIIAVFFTIGATILALVAANTTTPVKPAATATPTTASPSATAAPTTTTAAAQATAKTPTAAKTTSPTTAGGATTGVVSSATAQALFPPGSLIHHPKPAISANCAADPAPTSSTTTIPASGNRVSIVPAPAGIGVPSPGSKSRYTHFSSHPPFCIYTNHTYTATVRTDLGSFTITLLPNVAPTAVNDFVFLAAYHYYDGIIFQRTIPGFVIQGGDPTGTGTGGPGYTFDDELPATSAAYINGAVGMANSGPNTNGSQFFVDVGNQSDHIQPHYTIFGVVTKGMNVVDAINRDGTPSGTPTKTHHIISISMHASL